LELGFHSGARRRRHSNRSIRFARKPIARTGGTPNDVLLDAATGVIYGTTTYGGPNGNGTIYKLTPTQKGTWKHTIIYDFPCDTSCPGGFLPVGNLIEDTAGDLYGTTMHGALGGIGGAFELVRKSKGWKFKSLYDFCQLTQCADGDAPEGLTYAGAAAGALYDGTSPLYGVTGTGGASNQGVAFSLVPKRAKWKETVLFSFSAPYDHPLGALTVGDQGNLFGTIYDPDQDGGLFELEKSAGMWGILNLHEFTITDGAKPRTSLLLTPSGSVVGTTSAGGDQDISPAGGGTIFEWDGSNSQTLHEFCTVANCADGASPNGGVTTDQSGTLFGTVEQGGKYGAGAIYQLKGSSLKLLYSFCAKKKCPSAPRGELAIDAAGTLFGTTYTGANGAGGAVFALTP